MNDEDRGYLRAIGEIREYLSNEINSLFLEKITERNFHKVDLLEVKINTYKSLFDQCSELWKVRGEKAIKRSIKITDVMVLKITKARQDCKCWHFTTKTPIGDEDVIQCVECGTYWGLYHPDNQELRSAVIKYKQVPLIT